MKLHPGFACSRNAAFVLAVLSAGSWIPLTNTFDTSIPPAEKAIAAKIKTISEDAPIASV
jgi:hypothetical protein